MMEPEGSTVGIATSAVRCLARVLAAAAASPKWISSERLSGPEQNAAVETRSEPGLAFRPLSRLVKVSDCAGSASLAALHQQVAYGCAEKSISDEGGLVEVEC